MADLIWYDNKGLDETGAYSAAVEIQSGLALSDDLMRDWAKAVLRGVNDYIHLRGYKDEVVLDDWEEVPMETAVGRLLEGIKTYRSRKALPAEAVMASISKSKSDLFVRFDSASSTDDDSHFRDLESVQSSESVGSGDIAKAFSDELVITEAGNVVEEEHEEQEEKMASAKAEEEEEEEQEEKTMRTDLPFATSDLRQPVKLRMGKTGYAALRPLTVMQCFDKIVKKYGRRPALHQKGTNPADPNRWTSWSWKKYRAKVDAFAKALIHIGFEPFDIINIVGYNSREWFTANMGAIAAGGVAAGIFPTCAQEACKYITGHSKAKVVVVQGHEQLEKYIAIARSLRSHIKALVVCGMEELPWDIEEECPWVKVYTFRQFLNLGQDVPASELKKRIDGLRPNHTCTLVYTSGTTGTPKAVMITHDNITWTVRAMITRTPKGTLSATDSMVSYFPLSAIAAQILEMHTPLQTGCQVYFAQEDAIRGTIGATLREIRPTTFYGSARIWEKLHEKLEEALASMKGQKNEIYKKARSVVLKYWESKEFGSSTHAPKQPSFFIAKKTVQRVLAAVGLDRVNIAFTASDPISESTLRFFFSIDLPVMDTYGQSECTGPHLISSHNAFKIGTVGRGMPGTHTKIHPESEELLYTGRHIFAGYMNMEEKTREAVDDEGYLHSGDFAQMDSCTDPSIPGSSGFITYCGRINELITIRGESFNPEEVEQRFKVLMPALSNCMVVQDTADSLCILLCLQVEIDEGEAKKLLAGRAKDLSSKLRSTAKTTVDVMKCRYWKEYLDNGVNEANASLPSEVQRVMRWILVPTDFTEIGGELTPTQKLKRAFTRRKYASIINDPLVVQVAKQQE